MTVALQPVGSRSGEPHAASIQLEEALMRVNPYRRFLRTNGPTLVPQLKELRFKRDEISGMPHLEANFTHWRPTGAWQREHQFSDGTLRLIGLLWSLMEGSSLLLLEEPELSLNEEIVAHLPGLIRQVQKQSKNQRQIILTTHSESLLSDPSIGSEAVVRFRPTQEGTQIARPSEQEAIMLKSGLPVGQVSSGSRC